MARRFSFEVVNATDYDDLRPGYAPEAIAWVARRGGLGQGSTVLDLAAGTGQLSRRLLPIEVDLVAVEPAANMRAVLEEQLPAVRALEGSAESIPLEDRSVDAVVVGDAFHHFERDAAFGEIRRVLRPGGTLALFWAWPLEEEHRRLPGMGAILESVERARTTSSIIAAYRSWAERPAMADGFGPFERREFPVTHVVPSGRLADLYATSSPVASMSPSDRETLLSTIADLARGLPETLRLPSRTVVDRCSRLPDRGTIVPADDGGDRSG
jgi:SAM-dependent methyltransferase